MADQNQSRESMAQPAILQHWSLDKRVPLALIITLLLQSAGITWWAATQTAKLAFLEDQVRMVTVIADHLQVISDRVTRVEEEVKSVRGDVLDIKDVIRNGRH